jgi:DNA invertase Pin-like site-specific DNA recombinase
MKAVAYVSAIPSFALGSDMDRQMARINAYAAKNDYSIVERFVDRDGPFDAPFDAPYRPCWQEVLDYCRKHKVFAILIDFYERLSTDAFTGIFMVEGCRKENINLIDCSMKTSLTESDIPEIQFAHQALFTSSEFQRNIAAEDAKVAL